MKAARTVSIVVLCLLAAIILIQNRAPVETHFLMVDVQTPQSILLIVLLLVGFGIGMLASHRMNKKKPEAKSAPLPHDKTRR
jgi:uncharacterized integral membrane protein